MTSRWNWFWAVACIAAAAWGLVGCGAHATVPQVEQIGQLAPSYHSIAVAPVHHDEPPVMGQLAGPADDDATDTVTTVSRADAGKADAAPEVVSKGGGLTVGGAR